MPDPKPARTRARADAAPTPPPPARGRRAAAKTATRTAARGPAPIAIDLALQGGGSHGAFTWGVLDRLLDDETITFDGVSGTSAGALNAAVLATGLADGGRAGAKAALRAFWTDVSGAGACFGRLDAPAGAAAATSALDLARFNPDWNPWLRWWDALLRSLSPYQFNPLDLNPLRHIVERHVRIEALRDGAPSLFIAATSVRTGQPRIFDRGDLTIDALLASACLPHLFRAVMIEGEDGGPPEPYWDGGYTGNPALWPLIYRTDPLDIVLVQINPRLRAGTPTTRLEIDDRLAEITFNAALVGELRAIAFVQRLVEEGRVDAGQYKNLRLHLVADEDALAPLHASSKLVTDLGFLLKLHDVGYAAADRWWHAHRADLGRRGTLDARSSFLEPRRASRTPMRLPAKA